MRMLWKKNRAKCERVNGRKKSGGIPESAGGGGGIGWGGITIFIDNPLATRYISGTTGREMLTYFSPPGTYHDVLHQGQTVGLMLCAGMRPADMLFGARKRDNQLREDLRL